MEQLDKEHKYADTFYMTDEQLDQTKKEAKESGFKKYLIQFLICTVLLSVCIPIAGTAASSLPPFFAFLVICIVPGVPAILGMRAFFHLMTGGETIRSDLYGAGAKRKKNGSDKTPKA